MEETCMYFHSLGLRSLGTCQHYFYGVDEIAVQFQKMGVPDGTMFHILATKFAHQESDILTTTCDRIALEVAEYIRSLKSTFDHPIVLQSERKGLLSRLSRNRRVFLLNRKRKVALHTMRKNITVAGQLELNAGVLKLALCSQEREKHMRQAPESLKLSEYVRAMVNCELVNCIVEPGDNLKFDVWADPNDSPAFNAACLIALWTMDRSVEFVGPFGGIEDANWRSADGLPKEAKCLLDVPISQFVYTLDQTKISELHPVDKIFLEFKECNAITEEKVYVGRKSTIKE